MNRDTETYLMESLYFGHPLVGAHFGPVPVSNDPVPTVHSLTTEQRQEITKERDEVYAHNHEVYLKRQLSVYVECCERGITLTMFLETMGFQTETSTDMGV